MTDREEKIRERAYGIWEEEGYPHGRAEDHWHRAAREVGSAEASRPRRNRCPRARPPAAKAGSRSAARPLPAHPRRRPKRTTKKS